MGSRPMGGSFGWSLNQVKEPVLFLNFLIQFDFEFNDPANCFLSGFSETTSCQIRFATGSWSKGCWKSSQDSGHCDSDSFDSGTDRQICVMAPGGLQVQEKPAFWRSTHASGPH